MKFFRKVLLFTMVLFIGFNGANVYASISPVYTGNDIIVNSSDTASDFGIDVLTITDSEYIIRQVLTGYGTYVDYWLFDNIIYMTVVTDTTASGVPYYITDTNDVLIYDLGTIVDGSGGASTTYYKIEFEIDAQYKIGAWWSGAWGAQLTNSPVVFTTVAPVIDFQGNFLELTGAWLVGIWAMVNVSILASIEIFYDSTPVTGGMTIIGILALFGLAFTLTTLGLTYVSRMIKK